jgi:chaperone modulatory protein CbpM
MNLPDTMPAIIEEENLTIEQLCQASGAHAEWIISLVEESIIEPSPYQRNEITAWRFSGASLRRVRMALRLERDLGVNIAGIALALDLMEELDNLRARLN